MCYDTTSGGATPTLQSIISGLAGNANLTGATPTIPPYNPIDVNALQAQAATGAANNQTASIALMEQLFPGSAAARANSVASLNSGLTNNYQFQPVTVAPLQQSPLLNASYANAQQQLALGGALPSSVQNATALAAGQSAGQSGLMGTALNDVVAQDLGLTSYNLQQQRLQTANTLGQQQLATNQGQQALQNQVQQFNSQFGANVALQNRAQNLQASQAINSQQLPAAGLDPGQVAGVTIANNQSLNAYNQQVAAAQTAQQNQNASLLASLYQTLLGHAASLSGNPTGGIVTPGQPAAAGNSLAQSGLSTSTPTGTFSSALTSPAGTPPAGGGTTTGTAPTGAITYSGIAPPAGGANPSLTSTAPATTSQVAQTSGITGVSPQSWQSLLQGATPGALPYAFP